MQKMHIVSFNMYRYLYRSAEIEYGNSRVIEKRLVIWKEIFILLIVNLLRISHKYTYCLS